MKSFLFVLLVSALLVAFSTAFYIEDNFPFRSANSRKTGGFSRQAACFSLYQTCNDPCYEEKASFFLPSRCCCPPPCPYRDDC
ncbi:hypothetical protein L596_012877 [Steinernema carpocapsae]|nr:hypothetical protein L596_012877 [Steinernema carpocapsae]